MSQLRKKGTYESNDPALSDETALYLIRYAVAQRRRLIYGRLDDGKGGHCAIGSFWADNPGVALNTYLVDEVAAVNDSVPPTASSRERWKKVNSWLRWRLRVLTAKKERTK